MVPTRNRLPADDRRAAILDAARTVFAREGFAGASTAAIARAAACSEPILYRHFASKRDLFAAAITHAGEQVRDRVLATLADSDDPLAALAELSADLIADPAWLELMRLRTLAVPMAGDPAIAATLHTAARHHAGTMATVIAGAQARGDVRADVDPDLLGWVGVAIGLLASYRHAVEGDAALADTTRVMQALIQLLRPEVRP